MWGMAKEKQQARRLRSGEARLVSYLEEIAAMLGHVGRAASARAYCTGLLLPGERKSVEPMAARIAPDRVQAGRPDQLDRARGRVDDLGREGEGPWRQRGRQMRLHPGGAFPLRWSGVGHE